MITVKKDAIKYKDSEGNMQSVGVLCQVGTFGIDNVQYATKVNFQNLNLFQTPKISLWLDGLTSLEYVFQGKVLNETVEEIEVFCKNKITSIANFAEAGFSGANNALKKIILHVDTSDCPSFNGFVWKQTNIEEIGGSPLDCSSSKAFNLWMNNCGNLKEIRFVPNTIFVNISFSSTDKLSEESIQSIIDGLADLTGQTAQTITFHATVKAKLTEEQIATITSKNWTLA